MRRPTAVPPEATSAVIGDLAAPQNLSAALRGADAVIHSAGLAHGMSGRPEDDYRSINTEATTALARAAEKAGAKRFIFLSSIRAQTGPTAETVLTEMDEPRPTDAYGRSKLAAEESLARLGLDWVALRPTLVYGPGVKGNMGALLELARLPLPLPLGAFKNLRSLTASTTSPKPWTWSCGRRGPCGDRSSSPTRSRSPSPTSSAHRVAGWGGRPASFRCLSPFSPVRRA